MRLFAGCCNERIVEQLAGHPHQARLEEKEHEAVPELTDYLTFEPDEGELVAA